MSDEELRLYQGELFQQLYVLVSAALANRGYVEPEFLTPVEELHREQLKAAYTNGYEDHAALAGGAVN